MSIVSVRECSREDPGGSVVVVVVVQISRSDW